MRVKRARSQRYYKPEAKESGGGLDAAAGAAADRGWGELLAHGAAGPQPPRVDIIEMDGVFTFVACRKSQAFLITLVDRATSCILVWAVSHERTPQLLQKRVYSDQYALYRSMVYSPALQTPMPDKSETFRVEGTNAELRHYIARLAREARAFPHSLPSLAAAVKLFAFLWNSGQLARCASPAAAATFSSSTRPYARHSLKYIRCGRR